MALVVGDIIQLIHVRQTATDEQDNPVYEDTHIARTRGSMAISPNVNEAESDDHGSKQMVKAVTSEAWEIEFEKLLVSEIGPLTTLGLIADGSGIEQAGTMKGSHYEPKASDTHLEINIYADADALEADTLKAGYSIDHYILKLSDENLEGDDFGSQTFNISVLDRPIRTDVTPAA